MGTMCACGRSTPHGIEPAEDCQAKPCLFPKEVKDEVRLCGTCRTCKHAGEVLTFPDHSSDRYEPKPSRFRVCKKVEQGEASGNNHGEGTSGFHSTEAAQKADAESLALVVDGSGYFAQLIVREDFGCLLWEENK